MIDHARFAVLAIGALVKVAVRRDEHAIYVLSGTFVGVRDVVFGALSYGSSLRFVVHSTPIGLHTHKMLHNLPDVARKGRCYRSFVVHSDYGNFLLL